MLDQTNFPVVQSRLSEYFSCYQIFFVELLFQMFSKMPKIFFQVKIVVPIIHTGTLSASSVDVLDFNQKLSFDDSSSPLSKAESISSSQYFSASDLSSVTSPVQNRDTSLRTMPDDNEKKCLQKSASNSSSDSDRLSQSSSNCDSVKDSNQEKAGSSSSIKEIFEGKKSIFTEESAETPSMRQRRSQVITKKISLPTFNSAISIDDSIDSNFETSTSTQVWSFGKNSYGQLGHGDLEDRYIELLYSIHFHSKSKIVSPIFLSLLNIFIATH